MKDKLSEHEAKMLIYIVDEMHKYIRDYFPATGGDTSTTSNVKINVE